MIKLEDFVVINDQGHVLFWANPTTSFRTDGTTLYFYLDGQEGCADTWVPMEPFSVYANPIARIMELYADYSFRAALELL